MNFKLLIKIIKFYINRFWLKKIRKLQPNQSFSILYEYLIKIIESGYTYEPQTYVEKLREYEITRVMQATGFERPEAVYDMYYTLICILDDDIVFKEGSKLYI